MDQDTLEQLHTYAFKNKPYFEENLDVGCFSCLKQYNAGEIEDYVDGEQTALCPFCSIDSVIPMDKHPENERIDILQELQTKYF